jgi:hypothetical protein
MMNDAAICHLGRAIKLGIFASFPYRRRAEVKEGTKYDLKQNDKSRRRLPREARTTKQLSKKEKHL